MQIDRAVRLLRDVGLVRDDNDGSPFGIKPRQQFKNLLRG